MSQQFWNKWLFVVSVALALQGVSWIVMGSFDPFGIYDGIASRAILGVCRRMVQHRDRQSPLLGTDRHSIAVHS